LFYVGYDIAVNKVTDNDSFFIQNRSHSSVGALRSAPGHLDRVSVGRV